MATNKNGNEVVPPPPADDKGEKAASSHLSVDDMGKSQVLLATAVATVRDIEGTNKPVRLPLDTGSELSFINENCVTSLGLIRQRSQISISGISSSSGGSARAQQLTSKRKLPRLAPFIDHEQIHRVGGRLKISQLPDEQKHQMILLLNDLCVPAHSLFKRFVVVTHAQVNV
ncbi:unnamed protein product [Orchesella dallaii]|uniref:Peptidase A2 domain-containing protein n=1 Tax=Orchesella dallaii TaxID=48710 RepID=A0ABP1RZA1_9HEXA